MQKFTNLLFDLDGTLIDPFTGITKSIQYALEKFNVFKSDRTEIHDILGAQQNQITSIGVTYGYGTPAELIAAGATYLCNNPGEIVIATEL